MSATHSPPAAARLDEVEGPPPRTTSDQRPSPPPAQTGLEEPENPLARLTPEQIEELGREFDALHDEVFADLGDRDSRYIRRTIKLHRQLVLAARAMLLGSRYKPLWVGGTAALSVAKILENMEIGHNVMHGQWHQPTTRTSTPRTGIGTQPPPPTPGAIHTTTSTTRLRISVTRRPRPGL